MINENLDCEQYYLKQYTWCFIGTVLISDGMITTSDGQWMWQGWHNEIGGTNSLNGLSQVVANFLSGR
jgi:hypothetical protein